jgi:hypothetical protein
MIPTLPLAGPEIFAYLAIPFLAQCWAELRHHKVFNEHKIAASLIDLSKDHETLTG